MCSKMVPNVTRGIEVRRNAYRPSCGVFFGQVPRDFREDFQTSLRSPGLYTKLGKRKASLRSAPESVPEESRDHTA